MAVTVSGTSITFNDSTVQTTAFTGAGSSPGQSATTYTTAGSYTFTIPSGVTKIKVTVVGGGGCSTYTSCGSTFTGNTGGTSSVSSGSQAISTVSATGGVGAVGFTFFRLGGLGSGGAINGYGGGTNSAVGGVSHFSGPNSNGSNSVLGAGATIGSPSGGAAGGVAIQWFTGLTPGATLSVTVGASANPGGVGTTGGPGVVTFEY